MKFSEYAKARLYDLGVETLFYVLCLGLLGLYFSWEYASARTPLLVVLPFMFFGGWLFWLDRRDPIKKDNKKDLEKAHAINQYRFNTNFTIDGNLNADEKWEDKKLSNVRINAEQKNTLKKLGFSCKMLLDSRDTGNIQTKTKTRFYPSIENGDILEIEGLGFPVFLPSAGETRYLLKSIFNFIGQKYWQSSYRKKDFTSQATANLFGRIQPYFEDILTRNRAGALKIFLSKEEFEISGKMMEGTENAKLFLITAIKTKTRLIVLLPDKTIAYLFHHLNYLLF